MNKQKLEKTFQAKSFSDIAQKLLKIAAVCDEMDHHPDVYIFKYKYITFSLVTHSEKKITEKDHLLAKKIDQIFD
ncbi:MAG: 4a-hydroxytetrahydrobiopterin dehydratase [Saprospiraceae bacterium]